MATLRSIGASCNRIGWWSTLRPGGLLLVVYSALSTAIRSVSARNFRQPSCNNSVTKTLRYQFQRASDTVLTDASVVSLPGLELRQQTNRITAHSLSLIALKMATVPKLPVSLARTSPNQQICYRHIARRLKHIRQVWISYFETDALSTTRALCLQQRPKFSNRLAAACSTLRLQWPPYRKWLRCCVNSPLQQHLHRIMGTLPVRQPRVLRHRTVPSTTAAAQSTARICRTNRYSSAQFLYPKSISHRKRWAAKRNLKRGETNC